jgi:hypothetical protein
VDSAKVGELDVLTGFMVMDGQIRLLVIEGLADGESMRKFVEASHRTVARAHPRHTTHL